MAYKVIILYQLYMPSYFLGTFTEYPRVVFEFALSSISDIMSFPILSFAPFLCSSAKVVHQPLKVERSGGKPFRSESSSYESIQPENLSPFNVCTQKCRRQRK